MGTGSGQSMEEKLEETKKELLEVKEKIKDALVKVKEVLKKNKKKIIIGAAILGIVSTVSAIMQAVKGEGTAGNKPEGKKKAEVAPCGPNGEKCKAKVSNPMGMSSIL